MHNYSIDKVLTLSGLRIIVDMFQMIVLNAYEPVIYDNTKNIRS